MELVAFIGAGLSFIGFAIGLSISLNCILTVRKGIRGAERLMAEASKREAELRNYANSLRAENGNKEAIATAEQNADSAQADLQRYDSQARRLRHKMSTRVLWATFALATGGLIASLAWVFFMLS